MLSAIPSTRDDHNDASIISSTDEFGQPRTFHSPQPTTTSLLQPIRPEHLHHTAMDEVDDDDSADSDAIERILSSTLSSRSTPQNRQHQQPLPRKPTDPLTPPQKPRLVASSSTSTAYRSRHRHTRHNKQKRTDDAMDEGLAPPPIKRRASAPHNTTAFIISHDPIARGEASSLPQWDEYGTMSPLASTLRPAADIPAFPQLNQTEGHIQQRNPSLPHQRSIFTA